MNDRLWTLAMNATLCCGVGYASTSARAASLSATDRDFLVSTAQGATYELATAKLALTKATRPDIKSYAHTMIADHQSLNQKLHQVARQNDVDLPTTMTSDKQHDYDSLEGLDGTAFDTAFVQAEVADNRNDVATEQKEADTTDNAQIKSFVERLQRADTKHAKLGEALQRSGQ